MCWTHHVRYDVAALLLYIISGIYFVQEIKRRRVTPCGSVDWDALMRYNQGECTDVIEVCGGKSNITEQQDFPFAYVNQMIDRYYQLLGHVWANSMATTNKCKDNDRPL